jgi:hypothetical protein
MDKYICIGVKNSISKFIFSDLQKIENIIIKEHPYDLKNPVLNYINSIHFSNKANKLFQAPFKGIWNKYNCLNKIEFEEKNKYYIIFLDISVTFFTIEFLNELNEKKNISLNLLFINPINDKKITRVKEIITQVLFDNIYSFDDIDSKQYGFIHTKSIYSKLERSLPEKNENELLFIGRDKNRLDILHKIYNNAKKHDIRCFFDIVGVKDKDKIRDVNLIYNKKISYGEVVKKLQQTNCLLEVLQGIQSGFTFRTYEAICYNKKLLTNNKNIVNMPFYDSNYIKIFDSVEDIDFEWIKKIEEVNYKYNGEFSPVNLLEEVKENSQKLKR